MDRELNRRLFKNVTDDWHIHMKKCYNHLSGKGQSKSQWHITFYLCGIDHYKKIASICEDVEIKKGTLVHCWQNCRFVPVPLMTIRRFHKALYINLPYDPEILHLPKVYKNIKFKEDMHCHVQCSTIYDSQVLEII